MLSAVFLIAAEFLLLHGWLVLEMPAERWKKLITLNAQSVPNALSLKKDFYGDCSTDAQDFPGGTAGSSLMSVGFFAACVLPCEAVLDEPQLQQQHQERNRS